MVSLSRLHGVTAHPVKPILLGCAFFLCISFCCCYFTEKEYIDACFIFSDKLQAALDETSKPGHIIEMSSRITKPKSVYYNTSSIRYVEVIDLVSKDSKDAALMYSFAEKYEEEIKEWFQTESNHTSASFKENICYKLPGFEVLSAANDSNEALTPEAEPKTLSKTEQPTEDTAEEPKSPIKSSSAESLFDSDEAATLSSEISLIFSYLVLAVKRYIAKIFGTASKFLAVLKDSSLTPYQKQVRIRQMVSILCFEAKNWVVGFFKSLNLLKMRGTVRSLVADFYYNKLFKWQSSLYFTGAVCVISFVFLLFLGCSWYFKGNKQVKSASSK